MKRQISGAVLVVLLLAAGIGLVGVPGACAASDEIQIAVKDNSFEPRQITIQKGQTVKWTNEGQNTHTVTSGTDCSKNGQFNSWIAPGESFTHTFEKTGEYPYFCIPHCAKDMTGTVIVE